MRAAVAAVQQPSCGALDNDPHGYNTNPTVQPARDTHRSTTLNRRQQRHLTNDTPKSHRVRNQAALPRLPKLRNQLTATASV